MVFYLLKESFQLQDYFISSNKYTKYLFIIFINALQLSVVLYVQFICN